MNQKQIKETAKQHEMKQHSFKNTCYAFISGGTLAVIGQILIEVYQSFLQVKQEMAVTLMIVTMILVASILTGLGLFDQLAQHFGAGVAIPITGFSNSLTSCAMEGKSEGPIYGIGSSMFKLAGSVLTYGISAAVILGTIRYVFFGG